MLDFLYCSQQRYWLNLVHGILTTCHLPRLQGDKLASELAQKLPAAALAALIGSLSVVDVAKAAEFYTPPSSGGSSTAEAVKQQAPQQSLQFPGSTANAPALKGSSGDFQLPEGNQWRYSEFINAVQAGKVERVRFSKEGGQLQARLQLLSTAYDFHATLPHVISGQCTAAIHVSCAHLICKCISP
jgi:hypothetical protein